MIYAFYTSTLFHYYRILLFWQFFNTFSLQEKKKLSVNIHFINKLIGCYFNFKILMVKYLQTSHNYSEIFNGQNSLLDLF